MRLATTIVCTFLLLGFGGLTGCAPADDNDVTVDDGAIGEPVPGTAEDTGYDEGMDQEGAMGDGEQTGQLFLEGELTDEGVECPAFRGDDGELYTLTGDLGGFQSGDRVRIVATPVEMSTCMQGTTVQIVEIGAIEEDAEEV